MTDFLLELRSEEIPARMQDRARDDLARLFAAELDRAGLQPAAITTYATPRRLALIARDLPDATVAVTKETKGPKTSAPPQALDGFLRKTGLTRDQLTERDGVFFAVTEKPGRATTQVLAEAIPAIVRAFPWPKSMRWGAASTSTESLRWVRPLHGLIALFGEEIVPVEIAGIHSGATTLGHRFHHPGPITIGSAAGYVEKLHACHVLVDQDERRRIIREGASALAAEAGLQLIEDDGLVTENAGLTEWPIPLLSRFDAAFLSVPPEVIQLTARVNQKYFVCRDASGALANAFICTANIHASDGGARIVEGNRKVLAARLSDARFFYDQDLKVPLEEQATKLDRIVFHEKLGTVADKVDRVAKLARWLVEEGIIKSSPSSAGGGGPPAKPVVEGQLHTTSSVTAPPPLAQEGESGGSVVPPGQPRIAGGYSTGHSPSPSKLGEDLADLAERAARLCKADLVTGMVGEFPELQGLMGGYYALAQGEDPRVAEAIRDHYKPVGQGDEVPTAPVTVAVSLADKLDSIAVFFLAGMPPSGSKDPYALRRAALAAVQLVVKNRLRFRLSQVLARPIVQLLAPEIDRGMRYIIDNSCPGDRRFLWIDDICGNLTGSGVTFSPAFDASQIETEQRFTSLLRPSISLGAMSDFFADRLKVQQREAGVRHDLIDAVFALGGEDDLVRLLARVRALQAFVSTEDGANLLPGYKRAANILKKEERAEAAPLPAREGPGVGASEASPPSAASLRVGADAPKPTPSPSLAERGKKALSYTPEPAEDALIAALDSAEPAAAHAVAAEDFEGAMSALASLRAPIDAFFDSVTVNDPAPEKRAARLALLARVRTAVHAVADFSKIEG